MPSTREVERDDLFTATEIPEAHTAELRHRCSCLPHEATTQVITSSLRRNEHAADTRDRQLTSADSYQPACPTNVADDSPAGTGDDVKVMTGVTIRLLRMPRPELSDILAVEEPPKLTKIIRGQCVVRDDSQRVVHP